MLSFPFFALGHSSPPAAGLASVWKDNPLTPDTLTAYIVPPLSLAVAVNAAALLQTQLQIEKREGPTRD